MTYGVELAHCRVHEGDSNEAASIEHGGGHCLGPAGCDSSTGHRHDGRHEPVQSTDPVLSGCTGIGQY